MYIYRLYELTQRVINTVDDSSKLSSAQVWLSQFRSISSLVFGGLGGGGGGGHSPIVGHTSLPLASAIMCVNVN